MAATRTHQSFSGGFPRQAGGTAEDHVANYWRKRVEDMLSRLEVEARRMLQLEAELSNFANEYYAAVGEATERLAEVEQRATSNDLYASAVDAVAAPLGDILASREAVDARKREMKTRYRQLAMEMHPDRATMRGKAAPALDFMQTLNAAYREGDLAALLRLEAEMLLGSVAEGQASDVASIERALKDLERAANTYAEGYRTMLNSPLNELMLRALSARLAGWDWMQAVVSRIERSIEEKERALVEASIAQISQWRAEVQAVA